MFLRDHPHRLVATNRSTTRRSSAGVSPATTST
jgi:hypothetical protein